MAARYQLAPGTTLAIETDAGLRRSTIVTSSGGRAEVTTGMGIPSLRPGRVRLSDGREQEGVVVSTGNPHFVIRAEQESFAAGGRPWRELGEEIAAHPDFPGGTNVEFWLPRGGNEIEIRIFERGVGPTRSSGTGTSASAAAAIASGSARSPLSVRAPGGVQTVEWAGAGAELQLRGPAERIAEGVAWL
jgi:diaminopimelate epimerase